MKYSKLKSSRLCLWWNDKTALEKVLCIIEPVLSVAISVFWLFGNLYAQSDFLKIGTLIASFGLAALSAFYVYDNWQEQRGRAYFQLCKVIAWLFMSQLILLPAYK